MKLFKALATIAIAILLISCASAPKFTKPTPPKEGMAAIYVYRPWTFANGAASPVTQLDQVGEMKLVNGGYVRFEAAPGAHKIAIAERFDFMIARTWPPVSIDFSTEANKEYYVRYSTAGEVIPGYFTTIKFDFAFQLVPSEIALKELTAGKN